MHSTKLKKTASSSKQKITSDCHLLLQNS